MKSQLESTFNFANLQGMAVLRRGAIAQSPDAKRAVAEQFEALFVNLMLREMRSAASMGGDSLLGSDRMRTYQSLHDQQLALNLSQRHGIGLADAIYRELGGEPPAGAQRPRALPPDPPAADFRPASPEAFVTAVWPHAERAAAKLGVDPHVLVAQAGLETGWGQSQIRDGHGRASFNLFGIKAGSHWSGPRAVVTTLEYADGLPERTRAAFRAYDSLGGAFDDYAALIGSEPRYAAAREAGSAAEYVQALQEAGYATDPRYADKILAILERGLPGAEPQVAGGEADTGLTVAAARPAAARGDDT